MTMMPLGSTLIIAAGQVTTPVLEPHTRHGHRQRGRTRPDPAACPALGTGERAYFTVVSFPGVCDRNAGRLARCFWPARQVRRFGGLAPSVAERLAGAASAPAQRRPGLGHRAAGCIYPQIAADEERAAVDGADGGRDLWLLTGNTGRLVVQGPGRAAAAVTRTGTLATGASAYQRVRWAGVSSRSKPRRHRSPTVAQNCRHNRPDRKMNRSSSSGGSPSGIAGKLTSRV